MPVVGSTVVGVATGGQGGSTLIVPPHRNSPHDDDRRRRQRRNPDRGVVVLLGRMPGCEIRPFADVKVRAACWGARVSSK